MKGKERPWVFTTSATGEALVKWLEEGLGAHSSILLGEFHGQRSLPGYSL